LVNETAGSLDSSLPRRSEVARLVPRLPLDVATNARPLVRADRLIEEDRVDRGTQVATRDGLAAFRTAAIELPAIDERPRLIEEEKVRRARRACRS
jgi:hypothetical protein